MKTKTIMMINCMRFALILLTSLMMDAIYGYRYRLVKLESRIIWTSILLAYCALTYIIFSIVFYKLVIEDEKAYILDYLTADQELEMKYTEASIYRVTTSLLGISIVVLYHYGPYKSIVDFLCYSMLFGFLDIYILRWIRILLYRSYLIKYIVMKEYTYDRSY